MKIIAMRRKKKRQTTQLSATPKVTVTVQMLRRKTDKYDYKKSDVMDNTTELAKCVTTQLADSDKRKLLHILKGTLSKSPNTRRQN